LQGFGVGSARRSLISPGPIETDPHPAIHLRWTGERTLSSLQVDPAGSFASQPRRIRLASPGGDRDLRVPAGGLVHFPALTTDQVTVTFPRVARRFTTTGLSIDPRERLPVGLSELDFPALRDLQLTSPLPGAMIHQPCGQGPSIHLDGRLLPTSVSASASDLVQLRSLPVRVCTPEQTVRLAAGGHKLRGEPGSAFTLSSVTLTPPDWAAAAGPVTDRRVRIAHWGDEQRTIRVGPGGRSYLAIRENYNRGWEANLDGRKLAPVRLDGWQQGFVLPKGRGGSVSLRFTPEDAYSIALRVGAGLALGLLVLVLLPPWRGRRGGDSLGPARRPVLGVLCGLIAFAVALISLPAAAAVPAACLLARRRPAILPWAAALAILAAAIVVVVDPDPHPLERAAAFGTPAQLLTVVGLALLAASLIPPRERTTVAD
jgi:arabinofuranan 3-O-arabinosyltransferase